MTACDLHHTFEGAPSADVVVLSNSLGTAMRMWQPQAEALASTHRLLRYDLRGHGRSPVPPPPYTLADLGADLIALLDRHGIDRASLCGVSLGGMVSMWVAAHAPERVARVALVSTSAYMGPPEPWTARAEAVLERGMAAVTDTVLERWFTPGFTSSHPEVVDGVRAQLLQTPPEGYAACCGVVGSMDLRADLGAIRAPTLVIAAAEDPSTPPEHGRAVAAGVAGARLVELPRGAHLVNLEAPDAVTGLLLEHLSAA
jgi:3-oxoadipate enol-lactonase